MNWHTSLTGKLISGCVMVAYCKAPTMDLDKVGFKKSSEPSLVSLQPPTIEEDIGLDSSILVFAKRSLMYFN